MFFSYFNTNMSSVNERFQELRNDASDTRNESEKLGQAFEDGFEAIPWLSSILANFLPRVNWGIRWDGVEKWALLAGLADRISLEHRYTSSYGDSWRLSQDDGSRITETKQVGYNFQPLIGIQLGFNQIWGGDLSVQTRWSKKGTFGLNTSASNITEDNMDEITMTCGVQENRFRHAHVRSGVKERHQFQPGLQSGKNAARIYSITDLGSGGQPREGTTRITIEPRVVTPSVSVYRHRCSTAISGPSRTPRPVRASRVPPFTKAVLKCASPLPDPDPPIAMQKVSHRFTNRQDDRS
jgi:hypothetical protein